MDSFANSDRQYSDGQNNREPIPEELQAYGFKPPVRLPDGSIELGDYLAANHLNFIINDIYKNFGNSLVVTESVVNTGSGYRKFSNGDIEMWGRAVTASNGMVSVSYPVQIPSEVYDIQVTDISNGFDNITVKVEPNPTPTGFVLRASNNTTPVAGRNALWRAVYHAPVAGA